MCQFIPPERERNVESDKVFCGGRFTPKKLLQIMVAIRDKIRSKSCVHTPLAPINAWLFVKFPTTCLLYLISLSKAMNGVRIKPIKQ